MNYDLNDIPDLPLDIEKLPCKPFSDKMKEDYACDLLDGVSVLNIPRPKNALEEQELVDKFLSGMRKLFSTENNWTFVNMLEASMDTCASATPVPMPAICTRCPATTRCTAPTTALRSSAASTSSM